MKQDSLYPLKFVPILKEKVWGGEKLRLLFNKEKEGVIGESWELSGVAGDVSTVQNGVLKGTSLNSLIATYKEELVGSKVFAAFGNTFPLLFKFIDAAQDLSVQLHPDDELAKKRHNSFGKTEMWYILEAEEDARLIVGFNRPMNQELYESHLSNNSIQEILCSEKVEAGDSFFIAPGTVHAIGGGIVVAEIQQTSDITYRIYDWDRPGTDGKMRQLHTEEALEAIDYGETQAKLSYEIKENEPVLLCSKPYFETNKLVLTNSLDRDLSAIDSFVVYMCVQGSVQIASEGSSIHLETGETALIPANQVNCNFHTTNATLLEVYIP